MSKPSKPFEPMLAGTPKADSDVRFPVLASPKLDGVRGVCKDNSLLSRSLKKIPNKYVQALMSIPEMEGLDGELTVGGAAHPNVMQNTMSVVMSSSKAEQFEFHVFDMWNCRFEFEGRLRVAAENIDIIRAKWQVLAMALRLEGAPAWIFQCPLHLVPHEVIHDLPALEAYEAKQLAAGYEGVMVRDPHGDYKHGRSTVKEGGLLKLKRFTDDEAIIIGFEEENENTNEAKRDEKGRTKRSTHAAGKVGKGSLGAFVVRRFKVGVGAYGPTFNIGTGMTADLRAAVWAKQGDYINKIVKFKHFEHGTVDAPRHPVFLGYRVTADMGK